MKWNANKISLNMFAIKFIGSITFSKDSFWFPIFNWKLLNLFFENKIWILKPPSIRNTRFSIQNAPFSIRNNPFSIRNLPHFRFQNSPFKGLALILHRNPSIFYAKSLSSSFHQPWQRSKKALKNIGKLIEIKLKGTSTQYLGCMEKLSHFSYNFFNLLNY